MGRGTALDRRFRSVSDTHLDSTAHLMRCSEHVDEARRLFRQYGGQAGARAAIEFLRSPNYNLIKKNTPDIFFAGNNLSAAHLWGLVDRSGLAHVTRQSGGYSYRGIRLHHGPVPTEDLALERGIPVTAVSRTLLDLAATLGERRLGACFNEARRRRIVTLDQVRASMARQPKKQVSRPASCRTTVPPTNMEFSRCRFL